MRVSRKSEVAAPFAGARGEKIYELHGVQEALGGAARHSFAHVVLPPGAESVAHHHVVSEETYYGLTGVAQMQVDGVRFELRPGDTVLIMPGEVHHIVNTSESDVEFLAVSAPAWHPDDTVFVSPAD